jgi:protein-disulfide isomerase
MNWLLKGRGGNSKMSSKQINPRTGRNARRLQSRPGGRGFGVKQIGLLVGSVTLAVLLVLALAVMEGRGSASALSHATETVQDKSLGAVNAPVVVVEYGDFQCPYCRQFALGSESTLRQNYVESGKVRLVFRHLAFIGPESLEAAEAAECANAQGRFWDYHDKLFAAQGAENSGAFNRENLKRFAAELELDTTQFNSCLDSGQYQARVQQDVAEADRLGVNSTPTFFVNGQLVKNGSDYQELQAAIEAALNNSSNQFAPTLIGPGMEE